MINVNGLNFEKQKQTGGIRSIPALPTFPNLTDNGDFQ